jgi:phosphoribosyl-ATP pyrophosphohydrolase/phosphoribosyl-AMP cyclohydrolase
LHVDSLTVDCDGDAILVQAHPAGPTCHTGDPSCFHNPLQGQMAPGATVLGELVQVLKERRRTLPEGSYAARLFSGGVDRIGKKVIEEAGESVIAAKNRSHEELAAELADLWFHSLMLAVDADLELDAVFTELKKRRGLPPRDA